MPIIQLPVEQKLGAILVMSGYLAGAKEFKLTPGLENVPVMHGHGTADPMVCIFVM
jgi:predicted esterase